MAGQVGWALLAMAGYGWALVAAWWLGGQAALDARAKLYANANAAMANQRAGQMARE